jgi:hypothetical protein
MIYLILSAAFDPIDSNKFIKILKIGFSEDLSYDNRITSYKNHNPSCKILNTIPCGDRQDEANLHGYFRKYRIFNKEWYEYNDEILDFFNTHTTKESLSELPYTPHRKDRKSAKRQTLDKIQEEIDSRGITGELKIFLESFYCKKEFGSRLKAICDLSEEDRNIVFDILPDQDYKRFYEAVGPERCRALSYNKTEISRELKNIKLDRTDIVSEKILTTFLPGDKLTKAEIKNKLANIYSDLGYTKTSKASDLEEYFILRSCLISNPETGKRDAGFEIIGRR